MTTLRCNHCHLKGLSCITLNSGWLKRVGADEPQVYNFLTSSFHKQLYPIIQREVAQGKWEAVCKFVFCFLGFANHCYHTAIIKNRHTVDKWLYYSCYMHILVQAECYGHSNNGPMWGQCHSIKMLKVSLYCLWSGNMIWSMMILWQLIKIKCIRLVGFV